MQEGTLEGIRSILRNFVAQLTQEESQSHRGPIFSAVGFNDGSFCQPTSGVAWDAGDAPIGVPSNLPCVCPFSRSPAAKYGCGRRRLRRNGRYLIGRRHCIHIALFSPSKFVRTIPLFSIKCAAKLVEGGPDALA